MTISTQSFFSSQPLLDYYWVSMFLHSIIFSSSFFLGQKFLLNYRYGIWCHYYHISYCLSKWPKCWRYLKASSIPVMSVTCLFLALCRGPLEFSHFQEKSFMKNYSISSQRFRTLQTIVNTSYNRNYFLPVSSEIYLLDNSFVCVNRYNYTLFTFLYLDILLRTRKGKGSV